MIKITVITITYNSEATLENTIKSVLEQGYENLEYIIIDGDSSDSTVEIIKKYEQYLAYWISEKDMGISDAFNKGLKKATGDIIGIINSDDKFCNNIFTRIVEVFENDIDYLYGNILIQDENEKPIKTMKSTYNNSFPYGGMPFGHPSLFMKKRIYDDIGFFNINYKVAMDFELVTRFYNKYIGFYLNENVAIYSRGGISDNNFIQGHKEVFAASIVTKEAHCFVATIHFVVRTCRTLVRKLIEGVTK